MAVIEVKGVFFNESGEMNTNAFQIFFLNLPLHYYAISIKYIEICVCNVKQRVNVY